MLVNEMSSNLCSKTKEFVLGGRTCFDAILPEQITGQGEKMNGCAAALMKIIISPSDVDQFGQQSTREKNASRRPTAEFARGGKTAREMQIRAQNKNESDPSNGK